MQLIPRHQVAKLLTDYSCRKLSGDEFVNEILEVPYSKDKNVDLVMEWIYEKFEPAFGKPRFDINNPPYEIRRQLALFRRFLLSNEPYRWPRNAGGSNFGFLRLLITGIACSVVLLTLPMAAFDFRAAIVAILSAALAAWMYLREGRACERDRRRAQQHARQFGDPEMWPFLTVNHFRRAGPSRRLWESSP